MCGISGFMSIDVRSLGTSESTIRAMTSILAHRGPDQEGYHVEPRIQLGVRRLSIQDVAGGGQPIWNEDRSVVLVFNGEIYNFRELTRELRDRGHRFNSRTDSEVIVHLYEELGKECVQRLNGQFAFALWDRGRGKLLLARDRVGLKPLFYTVVDGILVFASEIKSILLHPKVPREMDPRCLDQVFTFFMPVNPRTMFRNVSNLPPGRLIEVDAGGLREQRYWEPPVLNLEQSTAAKDGEWVERLRAALEKSIGYRMIADVPIGVFLSGGLDSCVIAHLVNRFSPGRIKTFSICHDDPYYDEGSYSALMAASLDSEHHELRITREQVASLLPTLVWRVEAPSCKTSHAAYLHLYKLAKQSVSVILTGEGADEALAGYPNVRMMKVLDFCRRHPGLPAAGRLLDRVLPPDSTLRVMYHKPEPLSRSDHASVMQRFGCIPADLQRFRSLDRIKARLYSKELKDALNGYCAESEVAQTLVNKELIAGCSFIQQAQYFEYLLKLPNYLLINPGDRAAMAHSVENRCPFLDHELIELCMTMPLKLRIKGLTEKYALRQAFKDDIPADIMRRDKRPFSTFYVSSIFREEKPAFLEEALSEQAVKEAGFFDYAVVRDLTKRIADPALAVEQQVQLETPFSLVATAQLWHQIFIKNFTPTGPAAWTP